MSVKQHIKIEQNNYECIKCDYKCKGLFLWKQHLNTAKHKNKKKSLIQIVCLKCKKVYKQRSGLWRHRKKCDGIPLHDNSNENNNKNTNIEELNNENNNKNTNIEELNNENNNKNTNIEELNIEELNNENNLTQLQEIKELRELMKTLLVNLTKDSEVKEHMFEQIKQQNKIISDMVPKIGNNSFNINVFLNERCRDALNMSDFIKSLHIETCDLSYTKDNGLVEGISSVLLNGLKQLDKYHRPIHCTDMKRETLYIKENDEWDSENCKQLLKTAINDIAHKKRKALINWEKENPRWSETEKGKEEYIKLVKSLMSDLTCGTDENKIIKNIVKESFIDKKSVIVD